MPEGQQQTVRAGVPASSPPSWELVVMISGAVALIGSFFPFLAIPGSEIGEGASGVDWSAWSNSLNLFPVTTLVVLYAVVASAQLAFARFGKSQLPERVAGFSWAELRLLLGILATLTMVGYFFREFPQGVLDRGAGMYMVTLASIGVLIGALMERREPGPPQAPRSAAAAPPSPGEIAILVAAGVMVLGSFLGVYSGEGESINAWHEGLIPLYLVPVVLGVAMAAQVALERFTSVSIPDRILGVRWGNVHRAFGLHAALMMLGFLVSNFFFTVGGESLPNPDKGAGFWLMLIAALGLAAGAVVRDRESSPNAPPSAGQDPTRVGPPGP